VFKYLICTPQKWINLFDLCPRYPIVNTHPLNTERLLLLPCKHYVSIIRVEQYCIYVFNNKPTYLSTFSFEQRVLGKPSSNLTTLINNRLWVLLMFWRTLLLSRWIKYPLRCYLIMLTQYAEMSSLFTSFYTDVYDINI